MNIKQLSRRDGFTVVVVVVVVASVVVASVGVDNRGVTAKVKAEPATAVL